MLMLMLGLKSPPHRGLLKLRPMRTLWPTPPSVNLHPLCTASLLLPSTDFRTSAKICVTYVDSGLQRSERESTVSTQRSLFLIFCLVFVFLRRSGQTWGGVGGYLALVLFSFSRFTRHGADDDDYSYYYSNYQYINYCYLHSQYIC